MYNRIDLMSAIRGKEQERILSLLEEVWVEEGAQVEPVDKDKAYCFVLIDGFIRAKDERLGTWLVPPGALFGLEEILVGVPPGRTYHTLARSTLLALSRDSLAELIGTGGPMSQSIQIELSRLAGLSAQRRLTHLAKRL